MILSQANKVFRRFKHWLERYQSCKHVEKLYRIAIMKKRTMLSAMQGAKNVYPQEFIALFRKNGGMVSELIIPPFSEYGDNFSSFSNWHLPPMQICGSFHSHPSGSGFPSQQDLLFFSKIGEFHIVAFPPFSLSSFKAFSNNGKTIELSII